MTPRGSVSEDPSWHAAAQHAASLHAVSHGAPSHAASHAVTHGAPSESILRHPYDPYRAWSPTPETPRTPTSVVLPPTPQPEDSVEVLDSDTPREEEQQDSDKCGC